MKRSFTILSALVFALLVPVLAGSAWASQITVVSVSGNWHDPVDNVPGSQQGQPVITNGVPTSSINWGVTSGSQSGYDFFRTIPAAQTLPPAPTPFFPLGTFTHRNFTVSDPSLTAVQLDVVLVLNVDGVQTGPLNFTFIFNHVESPNNPTPPATCPYPTPAGEGCTDRVTFVSSPTPTTFKVGGVDYTLSMSFTDNGNPVAEFITREGRVNTANLVGQFTLPPLTSAAPVLTVTKSGPATMDVGQWGNFAIDVRNTGASDAWNATVRDLLPDGATGGMCDLTPEILSARVYAADGVTPVAGKGPLNSGSDYSLSYSAAPNCRLDITMLTAAGRIGPNERLIIRYRTQLDNNTQNGVTLTNVAGAIQWFDADSSNANRQSFTRTLTNGTPGVVDHEDAYSVTVALSGYFFEKTVADLTSGANPATTAAPGDKLRYTLRFRTTNQALSNFRIFDDLDALNAQAAFAPGTLALVASPGGADISATSSTGGAKGTGVIDIRNLNVAVNGEVVIQFDITLKSPIANSTVVANQATLHLANGTTFALSDDPNVNGAANSNISGDEDPTRVTIVSPAPPSPPAFRIQKISTDLTGDPNVLLAGETLRYTITVKNIGATDAVNVTLRDAVPANTTYVAGSTKLNGTAVADVAGQTALATSMPINPPGGTTPGGMPADASSNPANVATITFDVAVNANAANGTVISNQGFVSGTGFVDLPSDDPDTPAANDPTRDTVGNTGYLFEKTVANLTSGVNPATTAAPGDMLRYTLLLRTTDPALTNFRIFDDLGTLNTAPAFVPGTLTLVTYPTGADISSTSSTAGTRGTGVIDIRNLNLPYVLIQFDVKLATTLTGGTVVANQSTLRLANGTVLASSDDPNVNGAANPLVSGDEDPTRVTIVSTAPTFLVQKTSTDLTDDPDLLLAGETLRYTITVKNIGNADAVNVVLRDLVPTNTIYVAGSTRLNGVAVPDSAGLSQLVDGMRINPPANTTPGSMPADASSNQANVATITFDVVVNRNVVNGTVISNQGFVSVVDSGIVDIPSDDPDTPTPNDPTRDVVGSLPLLYAEKRVALLVDLGSPGIVDPGDVLRYTITVQNNSTMIPSTRVILRDTVPANTTYVANSTLHNGLPVGQPDGGISPLASGISISSGFGIISPGAMAVVQFELRVNAGTPAGTVISNQAVVTSYELPNRLTDGDGNPATGPEPTVVVVGAGQQLSIMKQVVVVGGGAAIPGAQLEYVVLVTNIGVLPVLNAVITDDLNAPRPGLLAYVNGSATLNGATAGVTFAGSTITANYAAVSGPLEPGGVVVLRFRATLAAGLTINTAVTNTGVVTWNQPPQTASASVSLLVGGVPGFSVLNGSAWHDADFDDAQDSAERALAGWAVDLYRDGLLFHTSLTDEAGVYRIIGVEPNNMFGVAYELRFRAPGAGANTAMLGRATSPFTNGMQQITNIVVLPSANLVGLNLPIQPNGVIFDSLARIPVAGTTVTLLDPRSASPLPTGCFDDAAQQRQVTLADGYYKFDINFSDPVCPSGGDYLIGVTTPGVNYVAGYSQIIPPASNATTAPFSVPACRASVYDAIPLTPMFCEVQASEFPPVASVQSGSAGTIYHLYVRLDRSQMPGTSQIFNNHIALDPAVSPLAISKTTPTINVTRGQLVPYVITVNNTGGQTLTGISIVDRLPPGFNYVARSALLDGVPTEPSVEGRELHWNGLVIAGTQVRTVKLLLVVGAGSSEGEYVNRAQVVLGTAGAALSGEATATVRLVPDATFDCTDVTGKVFNDANGNGLQDDGEDGLPRVRVVTARGLQATTDQFGRYHITCAITPNESRGSNFVLKLDDRTLPGGFRMTTGQVQIQRATRGKALSANFGASIQRVVSIDLLDDAFEPGTTEIRVQWRPRLNLLLEELRKAPAVLRLSYVADTEDAALVERRMKAVKQQLTETWRAADYSYALTIEPEVFWRRGAPPKRLDLHVPGSK